MYNVSVQLPDVDWSTVAGPRSRGINRKEIEKAQKVVDSFYRQLKALGMWNCYVLTYEAGKEVGRLKVEKSS